MYDLDLDHYFNLLHALLHRCTNPTYSCAWRDRCADPACWYEWRRRGARDYFRD